MIYTIDEIQKIAIPIVKQYGIDRLCLFGSYARGDANENSDLDFLIDKGELKGLMQYISLLNQLEEKFNCHVDLVSTGTSNKKFLNKIKKDRVLLYERER